MSHAGPSVVLWALIAVAVVVDGCRSVARAEPGKCRAAVVKQLAAYGRSALATLQRCEDAVVAGKRPAATDCATEPDVVEQLTKARAKVAKAVAAKCGGKDKQCDAADSGPDADDALAALGWEGLSCPAAAGAGCVAAVDDCGDIGACVACAGDGPVREVAATAYDALAPAGTPVDKALRKCQRALGKEAAKLFAAVSKLGEACWAKVNAGKAGFAAPCPAGDASGATLAKTTAARDRARERICKACGGKDGRCGTADDLAVAAIGFAASCPTVTIPGGAACGGAVETLDDLATCTTCVAEFHAGCLGALGAPWGGDYPAYCAAAAGIAFQELPGTTSASLASSTFDFTPGIGFDPAEATDGVVRTRIAVAFDPDATVAQANAVLTSLEGEVLSMLGGVPALLIRIPDPGTLAALDALIAETDAAPGVDFAARDLVVEVQDLPPKFPRPLGRDVADDPGLDVLKHLIAARVPAAWNAAPPLGASEQRPPALIVADAFGDGPPANTRYAVTEVFSNDFLKLDPGNPGNHGYRVLGIAVARLTGQAPNCLTVSSTEDHRPCAVGLYPSLRPDAGPFVSVRLRAVDFGAVKGQQLSLYQLEDAIVVKTVVERAIAQVFGFPSGGVVVNTSLGTTVTPGNPDEARRQARLWMVKVRQRDLEDAFLHVTAAGNVRPPKPGMPVSTDAVTEGPFTAAALIDGLPVPNLPNVLVVENRSVGPYPFLPGALFVESKRGGHLSAVGANVWTIDGPDSGTSYAAPQVAALAAFLWQIRPSLTVAQVRQQIIDRARAAADGAPMIDAYATMLAADALLTDAPVRKTILDIDDDGDFDRADVTRFFSDWQRADTLAGRLYSRVDLRGARGAEDVAFDLDLDGDVEGATVQVERQGQNVYSASFNEAAIERDEEIVCHYAFTSLYTRDPLVMVGDDGERQCCQWLRDNGRLPAEAPCFLCPRSGGRNGTCEPEQGPLAGFWRLTCSDGFMPSFNLLEDGTVTDGFPSFGDWITSGAWTTAGDTITVDGCPRTFLPRGSFSFESEWRAAPVPPEFGVQSCGDPLACPALKGTFTARDGVGRIVREVQCDSRNGFARFADPRDQQCHGACGSESQEHSWPHYCGRRPCGRANALIGCHLADATSCPDGLVCRQVRTHPSGLGCACVPAAPETCTTPDDCPGDTTCCLPGPSCGGASWLQAVCIEDRSDLVN